MVDVTEKWGEMYVAWIWGGIRVSRLMQCALSVCRYDLDVITIDGKVQDGLWELKKQHPEIEAVIMGTRMTDPYSGKVIDM